MGDFNIKNRESDMYKSALSGAFSIPDAILKANLAGSNVKQDKIDDQILFCNRFRDVQFRKAGIFDYYDHVFTDYKTHAGRIDKNYEGID